MSEPFLTSEVDEVSDGEVTVEFFFGFPAGVDLESSAVIVFIEDEDPSWDKIHLLSSLDLSKLLLSFAQGLIRGEHIYIFFHYFLLLGIEVLEHMIDPFTVKQRIVLLVIVQDAKEPALMILVHILIDNLLTKASHSYRMLKSGLLAIFTYTVAEDLLVELDGS